MTETEKCLLRGKHLIFLCNSAQSDRLQERDFDIRYVYKILLRFKSAF